MRKVISQTLNGSSEVTVHNLDQIEVKQREATETYDCTLQGDFEEADPQDGMKCEQLRKLIYEGNISRSWQHRYCW